MMKGEAPSIVIPTQYNLRLNPKATARQSTTPRTVQLLKNIRTRRKASHQSQSVCDIDVSAATPPKHEETGYKGVHDRDIDEEDYDIGKVKLEPKDDSQVVQMEVEHSAGQVHVIPLEEIFPANLYTPGLQLVHGLDLFNSDMWEVINISQETVKEVRAAFGPTCCHPASPFFLNDENLARILDSNAYLDGEFIDAALVTLCGFLGDCFVVLPNQFLSDDRENIAEWLPPCVQSKQCKGIVFTAHHENHWCSVAVHAPSYTVLYMDSCPTASSESSKAAHKRRIQMLCDYLSPDEKVHWNFVDQAITLKDYFALSDFPLQSTATDCGVMCILYAWMALTRFNEGRNSWYAKFNLENTGTEVMSRVRLFLAVLVMMLSQAERVVNCAARCDTSKWVGLKLFPHQKKSLRVDHNMTSKQHITRTDTTRYLKVHFPDTMKMVAILEKTPIKGVALPEAYTICPEFFGDFMTNVKEEESDTWQDKLAFICSSFEAMMELVGKADADGLRINYQMTEGPNYD